MFADPQTVTVNGTPYTLPRQGVASPDRLGTFANADGTQQFDVRQNKTNNRRRREARFTVGGVLAADPITGVNKEVSASVIFAVDEPKYGFSDSELTAYSSALITWLTASSNANLIKMLGGEL